MHVDHFAAPWKADGATTSNDQHGIGVDVESGIVESRVIVFRAVEDNHLAFEAIFIARVSQIPIPKALTDYARLDQGCIEQVAAQREEARFDPQWILDASDDVTVWSYGVREVISYAFARYRDWLAVQ